MCNSNNDSSNNQCEKSPSCNTFFQGFQLIVFENKPTFIKKAVLHATTLMQCTARQVLGDIFSTNQGNGTEMTFVTEPTKINLKNLKI